jgi:hypothetical protein
MEARFAVANPHRVALGADDLVSLQRTEEPGHSLSWRADYLHDLFLGQSLTQIPSLVRSAKSRPHLTINRASFSSAGLCPDFEDRSGLYRKAQKRSVSYHT